MSKIVKNGKSGKPESSKESSKHKTLKNKTVTVTIKEKSLTPFSDDVFVAMRAADLEWLTKMEAEGVVFQNINLPVPTLIIDNLTNLQRELIERTYARVKNKRRKNTLP